MEKILSAILFTVFGVVIVIFWPLLKRVLKGIRKQESKQVNNMSRNDYFPNQSNQTNQRNSSGVDESRPATVAVIYRSEMDYISRCIHDYPNIETGGQLFGFLREDGVAVVCYAIGPGRNANHQSAFFNQDSDYLQNIYNEISLRYGLRYIGEWHSHHQLGLAKPSGHDASTIVHGIQRSNFRHFLLCIGNCDNNYHSTLNAFTFHINDPLHYFHAPWKIIEIESPYRPIVDRDLQNILCHPHTQSASYGSNYILSDNGQPAMITPNYSDNYWLNQKANNLILKNIINYLSTYKGSSYQVKPQLDEEKRVHLIIQRSNTSIQITFGDRFPEEAPIIVPSVGISFNRNAVWQYDRDIYYAFTRYFEELFSEPEDLIGSSAIVNQNDNTDEDSNNTDDNPTIVIQL